MNEIITVECIEELIYLVRGQKVILDEDLADPYQVETRRINEQVKGNSDRFPEDFMFRLTSEEFKILKSQFATSRWGGRRKLPYAFTEQGVAMLSSVLNSPRAIKVNIQIMRTFVYLRKMLMKHKDLAQRLDELEKNTMHNLKWFSKRSDNSCSRNKNQREISVFRHQKINED